MKNYKNNGHWLSDKPIDPEGGSFGFVYCITNLLTGKKYIGRKAMKKKVTKPPLRGKKRRRVTYIESNWKTYTSSSDYVNADIKEFGKDNFKFEVLFCKEGRGELSFAETATMHKLDVLTARLEDGSRAFYNQRIPAVKFIPKDSVSDECIQKLKAAWTDDMKTRQRKTVKEWYTPERREAVSKRVSGENNPMFGKTAVEGENHPCYGLDPWYQFKGLNNPSVQEVWMKLDDIYQWMIERGETFTAKRTKQHCGPISIMKAFGFTCSKTVCVNAVKWLRHNGNPTDNNEWNSYMSSKPKQRGTTND